MKSGKLEIVPKIKVLVDTNVIISALYLGGKPLEILDLSKNEDIEMCISPFILDEIQRVLREKLHWEAKKIKAALVYLESFAKIIQPRTKLNVVQGKEADNRILEAAVECSADFLVTGDRRHLQPLKNYKGIRILSPNDFLEQFTAREK